MQEALISYLLESGSPVSGIVGDRIYWVERPQGSPTPALVLTRVSDNPDYVMDGPSGFSQTRVQFDAYAETYAGAVSIVRALRDRLSGVRFEQDGVEFQGAFIDGERDQFEDATNTSERFYRVSVDYMVSHA
jgi:hypothetical protein